MTAATAYDAAIKAANKYGRALDQALIGNGRAAARFRRKLAECERAIDEWGSHPSLRGRVIPDGARFTVRDGHDRRVCSAPTLALAQARAVEAGIRSIDVSACGVFVW